MYFVGLEEDGLPISGHVTVIEVSSASISMMPLFIVQSYNSSYGLCQYANTLIACGVSVLTKREAEADARARGADVIGA